MTEGLKKVLDYLLPRLVMLICLPADYLGILWLVGLAAGLHPSSASQSAPPIDTQLASHPIFGGLMVFGFFESEVVRNYGLATLIVASVLWVLQLIVGKSLPRRVFGLVRLLFAVAGVYFAKAILHG
jgi:succinate-acetate transporter protein